MTNEEKARALQNFIEEIKQPVVCSEHTDEELVYLLSINVTAYEVVKGVENQTMQNVNNINKELHRRKHSRS